jgi:hypothetical protein
VAKGKLLKEQIAKEKREAQGAIDAKSAGTQHRHPRGKSPEDPSWIEGQTKLPASRAKEVARNSLHLGGRHTKPI